jgi:riboflavin kinase / FMN adenylyltransferase
VTLVSPALTTAELPRIGPAALVMGVFDGLHAGHRALIDATRRAAAERGAASVALIFEPHPDEVIRPGRRVPRLVSPLRTRELVAEAGIDHVVALRFDEQLRALAPEEFLAALAPEIELRALVMTPDSAFGHRRAGTPQRMTAHAAEAGYDVVVVPVEELDGLPVSSSRVREAVAASDLRLARRLLGRPPTVEGTVIFGDGRGRELGFPTANLRTLYEPALPPLGIYLGSVEVLARGIGPGHPSLVSVGVRPTFVDHGAVLVEVYLLDWDGDLYGAQLCVEIHERLRDERRFESVEELVDQMRRDEEQGRRLIAAGALRAGVE